jgi:asparagine synthase (glutamine-hydrolysing)
LCGIAGAIGDIGPEVEAAVRAMTDAQVHRGPDDVGFFSSGTGPGAALGFRRLAIIDLSEAGHQPMLDAERGNVIVFNGEIYNYAELRAELAGLGETFHSQCDTEVLLRAYGRWGKDMLRRLRGMFAFAIYDRSQRTAFVARDRLGIKPLYVAAVRQRGETTVLFASELRALLATGIVPRTVSRAGAASYLWNGFVVGPWTIVDGVTLLPAGSSATIRVVSPAIRAESYWTPEAAPRRNAREAREALGGELETAVRQHLVSDVPLGVFLSGGVDSSAVAAMAVRAGGARVKTFHIGFEEAGFDESAYASAVAKALGTEHFEFRLTQERFREHLGAAMASLDQPTFDALNTYFVSRVVRENGFTVALAGTGGDELFGGYRSFRDLPRAQRAARISRVVPDAWLAGIARRVAAARTRGGTQAPPQTRWAKLGDMLRSGGDRLRAYQIAYGLFTRDFLGELATDSTLPLAPDGLPPERARDLAEWTRGSSDLAAVSIFELSLFLGDRLLRDSDAASMAVSLELRVPLLDHRVVEAAAAVPDAERFRPVGKKTLLKSLAMPNLDPKLFDRPKAGFVLPIDVWARDQLAEDLRATFGDRALNRSVGLNPDALAKLFTAFRSGAPGIYWSRIWAPYILLRWCQAHGVSLA